MTIAELKAAGVRRALLARSQEICQRMGSEFNFLYNNPAIKPGTYKEFSEIKRLHEELKEILEELKTL